MLLVLLVKEQDDMYTFAVYYSTNRAVLVIESDRELGSYEKGQCI